MKFYKSHQRWSTHALVILGSVASTIQCVHAQTTSSIAPAKIAFEDRHAQSGMVGRHFCSNNEEALPRFMVAGVAVFDYDNDQLLDILLLNQSDRRSVDSSQSVEAATLGRLYRNLGAGRFIDVTESAGLAFSAFALGVCAGDMDNDGDQDLAISSFGPILLLENNGDGSFSLTTQNGIENHPGKSTAEAFGAGVAMLDIQNDGNLDLFVANYVEFTVERHRSSLKSSFPYPPGPKDFPPAADWLFRSHGDGRFTEVSKEVGIATLRGPTMGIVSGDWDGDGDSDLFLCSDAAPNQYFVNDGSGRFVDRAIESGLAFDLMGNVNGSMGVDSGDFDNDGKSDLLITNYTGQMPVLYRCLGDGVFEDVSRRTQIGRTMLPHTNWGVVWIDVENDGDLDAFFANGHFLPQIEQIDQRTSFRVANTLMENLGNARFRDISVDAGSGLLVKESSRGAASGDWDRDGDMDLVILNFEAEPTLLINETKSIGNWIDIRLVGVDCNRDALGAVVTIEFGGPTNIQSRTAMVHAGRGYQSHFGTELHFGIGRVSTIDRIQVRWPGRGLESFSCDRINGLLHLIQGKGSE